MNASMESVGLDLVMALCRTGYVEYLESNVPSFCVQYDIHPIIHVLN